MQMRIYCICTERSIEQTLDYRRAGHHFGGESLLVTDAKESKNIPVGIGDFEAPEAIINERQLLHERRAPPLELAEEHVGVQSVDVRIPSSPSVSGVVWLWKNFG